MKWRAGSDVIRSEDMGILDDFMEDMILNLIDLLNRQRFIRWLFGIHDFHVDLF
jgi:hypothetical protein